MNFDPEMDALNGRKMKSAMKIVVSIDPKGNVSADHVDEDGGVDSGMDDSHPDEAQDRALIEQMLQDEEMKDKAEDDAAYASDEDKAKEDMMGGMSHEDTLNEFKDKAPRSLGQRVRLDIAKKAKPA